MALAVKGVGGEEDAVAAGAGGEGVEAVPVGVEAGGPEAAEGGVDGAGVREAGFAGLLCRSGTGGDELRDVIFISLGCGAFLQRLAHDLEEGFAGADFEENGLWFGCYGANGVAEL